MQAANPRVGSSDWFKPRHLGVELNIGGEAELPLLLPLNVVLLQTGLPRR